MEHPKLDTLVFFDTSGSMVGAESMAVMRSLAMALSVDKDVHAYKLGAYAFSGPSDFTSCGDLSTTDHFKPLTHPFGGGTDLRRIIAHLAEREVRSVRRYNAIIITDGFVNISEKEAEFLRSQDQMRLIVVSLTGQWTGIENLAIETLNYLGKDYGKLERRLLDALRQPWPEPEPEPEPTIQDAVREAVAEILGDDVTQSLSELIKGVTKLVDSLSEEAEPEPTSPKQKVVWRQREKSLAHAFRHTIEGNNSVCGSVKLRPGMKPAGAGRLRCQNCETRL